MSRDRKWRFPLFGRYDDYALRKDLNLHVMLRLEKLEELVETQADKIQDLELRIAALEP